jgi:hypothetical protein
LPESIGGRSLSQAIDDFAAVLRRYCSATLSMDIESVRRTFPMMSGLTLAEVFDRFELQSAEAAE